ncbi:MAG TPA: hypothetical protein PLP05_05455, partial [Sedimentisphaerales bacterium]|nr:hypothetical protein [Sedimentisphaerales bacterium]
SSGNGHDGTAVNSPSFDVGVLGKSVSIGGGSYINCGGGKADANESTWADITGPMSLCMWYKSPDLDIGLAGFITKGNTGGYRIEQDGGWGGRLIRATYYLVGGRVKAEGSDVVVDGTWHHIASVYDGSYVKLYIDGQLDAQSSASGLIATNNWDVAIGQNLEVLAGGSNRALKGLVDDVRIYGRALSQAELKEISDDIYRKVSSPKPADGTEGAGTSLVLEWVKGGAFSRSYDIYLGTNFDDVNNASRENMLGVSLVNCKEIVYDVNGLEYGKTYYWRVDGVGANGNICKGDVWEFSTLGNSLVGWWKFDGDMTDSSGNGRDGSLKNTSSSSTYSYVDGPFGGQAFESINGAYIGIDGSGDAEWAQMRYDAITIAMWMKSSQATSSACLISKGNNAYKISQYSTLSYGRVRAYASGVTSSGPYTTANCFDGQWHHVVYVLDRLGKTFRIYVDGQLNNFNSIGSSAMTMNSYDLAIGANPAAGTGYYFRGAIDDVKIYDCALSDAEIEAMANPKVACMPMPMNGSDKIFSDVVLSWEPTGEANSYDVYLGTDESDVETGTVNDAVYKGNFDVNSYDVNSWLERSRTYYWRVDEICDGKTVKGLVWQFTTAAGGDFDGDGVVGYADFALLSEDWLKDVNVAADGDGDGLCNMVDYAIWARDISGKTYYVDSVGGNDNNNGLSQATAWKSITKVNAHVFGPGDRLLFKAGSQYTGQMAVKGSGAFGAPIVIDMYGEGNKPRFDGNGTVSQAVYLYNVEYWEVNNLEITNTGATRVANRRGIYALIENYGLAKHIYFRNLYVHDVNGSLSKAEGGGWGIKVSAHGSNSPRSRYDDVRVEDCHVVRCDRNGIGVTGGYGSRNTWFPGTNIFVRGNLIEDIGGDVILMIACDGAVIEYNVINGGRTRCDDWAAGIWPTGCDNTLIQYNEVSGMVGTNDGEAFDSDNNCENTIFQYNYTHDNQGGFMLICCSPDDSSIGNVSTTVRYNISQNDGDFALVEGDGAFSIYKDAVNVQIYNNVFYVGPHLDIRAMRFTHGGCTGDSSFLNNIWYVDGRVTWVFEDYTNYYFCKNVFYGNCINRPANYSGLTSNPMFVSPGSGGSGIDSVTGYMLQNGSPCLGTGQKMRDNGGRDYWGNAVPTDSSPDIGAHQKSQ